MPNPQIDAETFVLWEPCKQSHGEVIPGYASYLLALGYKVLVLMSPARIEEGLFSRMSHPRLTLSRLPQRRIRRLMRNQQITRAAGVMITTIGKLSNAADGRVDLDAVFGAQRPRKLITVDHDVAERVAAGVWNPRTVTLRALDGIESVVVNPHDFGPVTNHKKTEGRTVFTMIGAAQAERRNQNIVNTTLERLIAAGVHNFELRLIGLPGEDQIPEALRAHVTQVGRVDFQQLYAEAETADFILTSFQNDNDNHLPYRTTKTSGSFQLCYGFATPCIVQRDFTAGTALNAGNSLLYETDDQMFDALHQAISLSPEAYSQMVRAMQSQAQTLYDGSLSNLKALITAQNMA